MASTMTSNPITNKRKKKKIQITSDQSQLGNQKQINWKSQQQQQIYSTKLLQALRNVRPNSPAVNLAGKSVRDAADRVLAAAAKGKTRWSRAILHNRLKIKFMKKYSKRQRVTGSGRLTKVSVLNLNSKNLPAVQRKTRVLGRLVPGCRKQSLQVVLDEVTDYIAALEMQVRAMTALADLISGAGSSLPSLNC